MGVIVEKYSESNKSYESTPVEKISPRDPYDMSYEGDVSIR